MERKSSGPRPTTFDRGSIARMMFVGRQSERRHQESLIKAERARLAEMHDEKTVDSFSDEKIKSALDAKKFLYRTFLPINNNYKPGVNSNWDPDSINMLVSGSDLYVVDMADEALCYGSVDHIRELYQKFLNDGETRAAEAMITMSEEIYRDMVTQEMGRREVPFDQRTMTILLRNSNEPTLVQAMRTDPTGIVVESTPLLLNHAQLAGSPDIHNRDDIGFRVALKIDE